MGVVQVARAYGNEPAQGRYRVLVDRLWLRGIKKAELSKGLSRC